ncbi:hypothetical protein EDB86DRAFT_2833003 [Lactarius hatsudake]|nr:hypothetical protein EDB86DRAFT_2833003 [Lactarius hatsudake]
MRPTRIHERRDSVPPPARATPVQPPATRAHKGEGRRINTLCTGYASPAFTHPTTPTHTWGCKRVGAPSPLCAGCATCCTQEEVHAMGRATRTHVKGVHGMRDNATRAQAEELRKGYAGEVGWSATRVGELHMNGRIGTSECGYERERVMVRVL